MTAAVTLHPITWKMLKQGHPWVTEDSYSRKFPANDNWVISEQTGLQAFILNDPGHPRIKGRLWNLAKISEQKSNPATFEKEFVERLQKALHKRHTLKIHEHRDNFYLLFGEADLIPGLWVLKLGKVLLIQTYAMLWQKDFFKKVLDNHLFKEIKVLYPDVTEMVWQTRVTSENERQADSSQKNLEFIIKEFGINYKILINQYYDFGIYTDMSSIRESMTSYFNKKKVLNLFSYTGAYGLFALKNHAEHVYDVDLSEKYLAWLEANLKLNPDLPAANHHSVNTDCVSALKEFSTKKQKFDFIICDPPSASSDGKKLTNAFKNYEILIPLMNKVLNAGGHMVIFLNTHHVTDKKFVEKMKHILQEVPGSFLMEKHLKLHQDCPTLNGFQEGSYLKGIIIKKER
jgi:23S rRNA (cytosine1962-C5)-methyltransferase